MTPLREFAIFSRSEITFAFSKLKYIGLTQRSLCRPSGVQGSLRQSWYSDDRSPGKFIVILQQSPDPFQVVVSSQERLELSSDKDGLELLVL